MNGRRARLERRRRRERADAIAEGTATPTRLEVVAELRRRRDAALAELSQEYVGERLALDAAYAQSKRAIQEDFLAAVATADTLDAAAVFGRRSEVVVAPANVDVDRIAEELRRVTRPV